MRKNQHLPAKLQTLLLVLFEDIEFSNHRIQLC